jgi:hypothetical protein
MKAKRADTPPSAFDERGAVLVDQLLQLSTTRIVRTPMTWPPELR